jgi:sodium-dependent dicarboxylate transporter 2/3/5
MIASVAAAALVYLLLPSLDGRSRTVAAIFTAAVILWITEALPLAVTALLSTTVLVVTGSLPFKDAFGVYGDQIILLFVGSFILAKSMENCGLDRRIAFWLLSRPLATRSASALILSIGSIACLISLFVSNTATTAMLLPIGLTILKSVIGELRGHPLSTGILLMLTWGSSIAVGTIIGTPPNVIGVGLIAQATGQRINFVQWAAFGMPITIAMLVIAWLQLRSMGRIEPPDTRKAGEHAREQLAQLGPLRQSERGTLIAFFAALALWILPGVMEYGLGSSSPVAKMWIDRFPEAVAALVGASLLFVLPARDTESKRVMTWPQATRIDWGTILLFAGGMALGKAAFDSGLAKTVGTQAATALGLTDVWAITGLSILLAIALSELASNTASATTMVPVAIAIAQGAHVSPIAPALGAIIGANLGFMLPISTAPNAIVYSSGLLPARTMMRHGLLFDVIGFFVTWGSLRLVLPMIGLV